MKLYINILVCCVSLLFVQITIQSRFIPNLFVPSANIYSTDCLGAMGPKPCICPEATQRFTCAAFKKLGLDIEECFDNTYLSQQNDTKQDREQQTCMYCKTGYDRKWYAAFIAFKLLSNH